MDTRVAFPRLARRVAVTTVALAVLATPFASAADAAITKGFRAKVDADLAPGINYRFGRVTTTGGRRVEVRIGTVDPRNEKVRLKALLSNNKVVKRDVVSKIVLKKERPGFRAMVATNGDMSTRQRVDAYAAPHSMAVSNGELLLTTACARPMLGIDGEGNAAMGMVRAHVSAVPPGKERPTPIHKVNMHRDDGHIVLYTRRFASSTQTSYGGVEVVLEMGKLEPNGTQRVRVLRVRKGGGNTRLSWGRAVLSVKNPKHKWVYRLKAGQRFTIETQVVQKVDKPCGGTLKAATGFDDVVEAQGGNYFTLRKGRNAAPSRSAYAPGTQRHPRTNIGLTADGRVLMVVADGRRAGSAGMTLREMGQLMKSLGAVDAFNGDGGGSSVIARYMAGKDRFQVANRPSDGRERPATQAFAAFAITD
jgi:hypothetical protein